MSKSQIQEISAWTRIHYFHHLVNGFHRLILRLLRTGRARAYLTATSRLNTLVFLFLFIEAQLEKRTGLRSIMRALQANEELQHTLGISSISAAQLSRKNNKLDPEILQSILCDLITKLHCLQTPVSARLGPVRIDH